MDLMYRNTYVGNYSKDLLQIHNPIKETNTYFGDSTIIHKSRIDEFISDRVISQSRKNVDVYLNRLGLIRYDLHELALATKLINPMDGFWLRENEDQTYENFVIPYLRDIFENRGEMTLLNALSSGGQNEKYFGMYNDSFGVVKKRLTGLTYDTESELAVYGLSLLMKVDTCPVYRVSKNETFSKLMYDFTTQSITHMRHALKEFNSNKDLYSQIVKEFPSIKEDLIRMLILDYVTAQDDRHMSNYALIGDNLYPLYDNGRSLFWDTRESDIKEYVEDVRLNATSFGNIGTYYDTLLDISLSGVRFKELVNLNVTLNEIKRIYVEAGYENERASLLALWTRNCLHELVSLDSLNV